MKVFTPQQHLDALVRRRIKFVVEKGAMARLFRAGKHQALQEELFQKLKPSQLASIRTRVDYDSWFVRTIESDNWKRFSRNGLAKDRWAYFAKLVNIIVYEIVSNRELFDETAWKRLQPFLHIPVDTIVLRHLCGMERTFPNVKRLKGMSKETYLELQSATRRLARKYKVPPIWFEAAWSAGD
jgi:hypothetical protein